MTVRDSLQHALQTLASADIESPRLEAELLLGAALGKDRLWLHINPNHAVDEKAAHLLDELVRRRCRHEPLAYILGEREFWSLDFVVTPETLIPRPETELLVETALELLAPGPKEPLRILDLGTGSGNIAVALAREIPQAHVVAIERSEGALEVARRNASRHGVLERIRFMEGSWFEPLRGEPIAFDLVVSNPPYVASDEVSWLARETATFEPGEALFGGKDGLDDVRLLVTRAPDVLRTGGWFLCEIGWTQGARVQQLAQGAGVYEAIEIRRDLEGRDRLFMARRG